jgi:hypothetical protein
MMTNDNIFTACSAKGLRPVCDYPSYSDGKCRIVTHYSFHFSYPPHNDQYNVPRAKTVGAYFYSARANGQWSFLNQGYTHRWAANRDRDGDTFCVKVSGILWI